MNERHVENLVLGAGLVGSITGWVLAENDKSGVLIDKSPDPGGVNGSWRDTAGNVFDYGRHIISDGRSDFATDFFTRVLDGNVRRFKLRRAIVLRNRIIPSAVSVDQWPAELRKLIHLDPQAEPVRLGSTRAEFAAAFGPEFADMVFDEMLAAYPPLVWQRDHGVPEETLLRWIFPWFFPMTGLEAEPDMSREQGVYNEEARRYHFKARHQAGAGEPVMYPSEGGFGQFIEAMLERFSGAVELHLGAEDVAFETDPRTLRFDAVIANDTRFTADRVFWCVPLPVLCRQFGWALPEGHPQSEMLGSFTFRGPLNCPWHEILFADPAHRIRRINFPGLIAGQERSTTAQVEFTTPHGRYDDTDEQWRENWHASLVKLGLVEADNEIVDYDMRRVSRGIVTTADLNAFVADCKARLAASSTNLITPHLAAASDNNSRLIPRVHDCVVDALGGAG